MKYSRQLSNVKGSATAEMFAEAKKIEASGKRVLHLEIGQPDYLPPQNILESTAQFIMDGYTQYTVSRGIPELRDEVAKYYNTLYKSKLDAKSEVIIGAGAKIGVYATLWSVVDPGTNVIILNPAWPSYGDIVRSLGGIARYIPIDENFSFDINKLKDMIDDNTVAIIVNSPSNPTGAIMSRKGLQQLYSICCEYDLLLVSDEIYNEYIYEGHFTSLSEIKDWKTNGVIINGLSKTFAMTGFRIGYALANSTTINSINKVMQLTASCPVNFNQRGGVVALQNINEMRSRINSIMPARRELASKLLLELDVEYIPPKGAIYAWFKIKGIESVSWANKLLVEKNVAVTPGRAFGPAGEEFIRISLATPDEVIIEGIGRIHEYIKEQKSQ